MDGVELGGFVPLAGLDRLRDGLGRLSDERALESEPEACAALARGLVRSVVEPVWLTVQVEPLELHTVPVDDPDDGPVRAVVGAVETLASRVGLAGAGVAATSVTVTVLRELGVTDAELRLAFLAVLDTLDDGPQEVGE
ncbi:hypothetical protein [Nitriliruptor alkaliphilus]|uniref:hypothetical protein n=1 Tax=Nitriliruptor alkaliphilus TaxID=427918 RepID=UPI0012EECECD|nr:hypothetical protein [Nitriliruptor alkaliphilus]